MNITKNLGIYSLGILILGSVYLFHPFIFSLAVPSSARYILIFLIFLISLLIALFRNIELIELFLFSWIAFAVCASAIFTEYDIKYYYILLSKILFLYSLLFLFSSLPRLKVFLINLLLIVFALCSMHIVIGFIYINFFDADLIKEFSIYRFYGKDDTLNGYFYQYHSLFGSFANSAFLTGVLLRSAWFTFEPNSTAILFALSIALVLSSKDLNKHLRFLLVAIFTLAGLSTISFTFLIIIYVSTVVLAWTRATRFQRVIILIINLIGAYVISELANSTSSSVRINNFLDLYFNIIFHFNIMDHLIGKGMAWSVFELGSGIDSGLLVFYTQLGIMFVLPFVLILLKAGKANEFAMVTLFASLASLNLQLSPIFILFIALLIDYSNSIPLKQK